MEKQIKLDVFGKIVLAVRKECGWEMFYLGEGKRRLARDIVVPPSVTEDEIIVFLSDLFHEKATPEKPEVVRVE
jgi:hypothetical protein